MNVAAFEVRFRSLTDLEIESYLYRDQPYACCGSLRADGLGIALLEYLKGDDPSTLIGLPLTKLVTMLKVEGYCIL